MVVGVVQGGVATFLPWKLHTLSTGSRELPIGGWCRRVKNEVVLGVVVVVMVVMVVMVVGGSGESAVGGGGGDGGSSGARGDGG